MAEDMSISDAFYEQLAQIVEANLENEQFGVLELAKEVGLSRSQVHRKLQALTGHSVSYFIREIRLQRAHELLLDQAGTASEIAYKVGFGSPTYFNKCFNDYFGYTPGEVKKLKESADFKPKVDRVLQGDRPRIRPPAFYGRRKYLLVSVIAIVILAVLIWLILPWVFITSPKPEYPTIAVLPFKTTGEEEQYLADGVQEEILAELFLIGGLNVKSRSVVEKYRNQPPNADDLVRDLKITHYLEGSARITAGNNIRIIVQLIDAKNDNHVWVQNFDRNYSQIFDTQTEIASTIASELKVQISPEIAEKMRRIPTESSIAWDYFLRARYYIRQYSMYRNPMNLEQAVKNIHKAIKEDPSFALAYAKLSEIYDPSAFSNPEREFDFIHPDSTVILAKKALELDSTIGSAYRAIANEYWGAGDLDTVDHLLKKAITVDPHNPDVYLNYSRYFYYETGEYAQSIKMQFKALALQDNPEDIAYRLDNVGWFYFLAGDYNKAIEYIGEAIDYSKRNNIAVPPQIALHEVYMVMGDYDKFRSLIEESERELGKVMWNARYYFITRQFEKAAEYYEIQYRDFLEQIYLKDLARKMEYGYALSQIGQAEKAHEMYLEAQAVLYEYPVWPYDFARLYAALNNEDSVYHYLDVWIKNNKVNSINADFMDREPIFDSWKEKPEFRAAQRRAKEVLNKKLADIRELENSGEIPKSLDNIDLNR